MVPPVPTAKALLPIPQNSRSATPGTAPAVSQSVPLNRTISMDPAAYTSLADVPHTPSRVCAVTLVMGDHVPVKRMVAPLAPTANTFVADRPQIAKRFCPVGLDRSAAHAVPL